MSALLRRDEPVPQTHLAPVVLVHGFLGEPGDWDAVVADLDPPRATWRADLLEANVTSFDPYPFAPAQRSADPLLESVVAPTTSAMVDFVTRVVGWKATGEYHTLSYEVNGQWDFDSAALRRGAVSDLREAVAADPKLRVLIVHGWNDLSCPFMGSVLTVDQMPVMGDPSRVAVREYPGGVRLRRHPIYAPGGSAVPERPSAVSQQNEPARGMPRPVHSSPLQRVDRCPGRRLFWRRYSGAPPCLMQAPV